MLFFLLSPPLLPSITPPTHTHTHSPPRSILPLASSVAAAVDFNPQLRALADHVVELLTEGGTRPFNAVHMRVEADAADWAAIMGGRGVSEDFGGGKGGG
jgi:hypothetical protein